MQKVFSSLAFVFLIVFPVSAFADGPYLNIPPTNAFDKIHTNSGSVFAANFSMPLNILGGPGVTVSANNSTHTVTITGTSTNGTTITAITCANNYQLHAVNASGFFFCALNNMTGSGQGSYNQTLANGILINSGGQKINFVNGTGASVHVVNSNAGNQVNVTVSASGSSGITSINSQTGPAYLINCQTGNTTCTNSTNKIVIGFGVNPVIINGNAQTVSKALTLNQLLLGGNANGGGFSFTNLLNVNATKLFQGSSQVVDTITPGAGISAVKSGGTYTITNTGILSAIQKINNDTTSSQTLKGKLPITISDDGSGIHTIKCPSCLNEIITSNATVKAQNYTFVGANGTTVRGNNATGTIIISNDNCIDTYQSQNIGTGSVAIYAGFTTSGSTTCGYAAVNVGTGTAFIYAGKTP